METQPQRPPVVFCRTLDYLELALTYIVMMCIRTLRNLVLCAINCCNKRESIAALLTADEMGNSVASENRRAEPSH
jgi:hypothetical protein